MTTKIYSIYDSKADAFMQPFFQATHALAIRNFTDSCEQADTIFAKHPGDFTLFHIGDYNDENAKIEIPKTPLSLGLAQEFIKATPELQSA